jgi:hypothetical protein
MKAMFFVGMAAGIFVTVILPSGAADDAQKDRPQRGRNLIMQMKLGHAQKVLEGMAVQDFDLIAKNGEQLAVLSSKPDWKVFEAPAYLHYLEEFHRQADVMTQAAKEKNVDGATLAYVQMTMTCVNCHKYVRTVRTSWEPGVGIDGSQN